jgi:hypothetical protein
MPFQLNEQIPLAGRPVSTPMQDIGGAVNLGNAFMQRQQNIAAMNKQKEFENVLQNSPDLETALPRLKMIDPVAALKLETSMGEAAAFKDTHSEIARKVHEQADDALAGMWQGYLDTANDDKMTAVNKREIKLFGIRNFAASIGKKVPQNPDINYVENEIARSTGRKQMAAENLKTSAFGGATAIKMKRMDEIAAMPKGKEKEDAFMNFMYTVSPTTAYNYSPESIEQERKKAAAKTEGAMLGKVATAKALAPIEISTAKAKEEAKAGVELKTEAEKQAVKDIATQKGGTESAENVLTAISQIEENPTILEKLPSGWANVGGAVSKFLPAESAGIYASNLDRISNIMSLEGRSKLKGQGQISDFEGKMLAAASTNIKSGTALQRRTELARIKNLFTKIKYRADNNIVNVGGKWYKIEGGSKTEVSGEPPKMEEKKALIDMTDDEIEEELNRLKGGK